MSSYAPRTGVSSHRTADVDKISLDKHLVKEYRLKFEAYYTHRYTIREASRIDMMPHIVPFLKALGFYHEGPRYVKITEDQFETLTNVCEVVIGWRRGNKLNTHERRCAAALAATAMLFTVGHNETERYLDIERESVLLFKADMGYMRICAKDAFSLMMSRFDQYLTCSPITPIYWERKHADALQEAKEWLDEILKSRKEAARPWRERKGASRASQRVRLYNG